MWNFFTTNKKQYGTLLYYQHNSHKQSETSSQNQVKTECEIPNFFNPQICSKFQYDESALIFMFRENLAGYSKLSD